MAIPNLTVEEIVELIKHSQIPNLVVEGVHDAFLYRLIEDSIDRPNVSIVICGGRSNLLQIYRRRNEFIKTRVAFLADLDMWLFSIVPSEYQGIIWTTGYSIENDLFSGSTILRFLTSVEQEDFRKTVCSLSRWFAFEVQRFLKGLEPNVDVHINRIVPTGRTDLSHTYLQRICYIEPPEEFVTDIRDNYVLKLRGKNILQLLIRYLSKKGRLSKFSKMNLLEICFRQKNHKYVKRIINSIRTILA